MSHINAVTINDVYPWGRSFDEYRLMFALSMRDLARSILSCADGPASFNAEMHALGHRVVSCDPLYRFSAAEIRSRVDSTAAIMIERAKKDAHRFVWGRIQSPQEMGRVRLAAMERFLQDYESGKADARYVPDALPVLSFPDRAFSLALCSHFLFLYSDNLPLDFHLRCILEMSRVADEVRIFPLLDMQGERSSHLDPIRRGLASHRLSVTIERVNYEFQRGGNRMMRISHPRPYKSSCL